MARIAAHEKGRRQAPLRVAKPFDVKVHSDRIASDRGALELAQNVAGATSNLEDAITGAQASADRFERGDYRLVARAKPEVPVLDRDEALIDIRRIGALFGFDLGWRGGH